MRDGEVQRTVHRRVEGISQMLHHRLGRIRDIMVFTWSRTLDMKMGESMGSIPVRLAEPENH